MTEAEMHDLIPESILKKRKSEEQWDLEKKEKIEDKWKTNGKNRKIIFKTAEQHAKEYENQEKEIIRIKREARLEGGFNVCPEAKRPFIISEVYPVRKSSERFRVPHGKAKAKEDAESIVEATRDLYNKTPLLRCEVGASTKLKSFDKATDGHDYKKVETGSHNALRNVVEVHLGNEKPSTFTKVDMEKALKVLIARDKPFVLDTSGKNYNLPSTSTRKIFPEFHISGQRAPLDFTLKSALRLISSSSVKWCHRVNAALSEAIHLWTFPQSSLPSSLITTMTLLPKIREMDFLTRRQQDWEDSFRNLYYMLRKNVCSMFYVYTSQFVVLFICNKFLGKKQSCNAYLSQSTRGLRSLLTNHDICFSMPLCHVEVEHPSEADLAELSEIEQRNLGQAYHLDSVSGVDNSSQSLLAFIGNKNVHGLYDFLLNYRLLMIESEETNKWWI